MFIVTPIVGVCNCSMFCCTLLYFHSSIAIILMGKRELIALLNLSSWCLVMVERLFLAVPRGCLQFVIVVFPDHTHLLFYPIIPIFYPKFLRAPTFYLPLLFAPKYLSGNRLQTNTFPHSLGVKYNICFLFRFFVVVF